MKLDTETLIKNRFWIVLGFAGVLALCGWVILLITVPSKVSKEEDAITKKFTAASKYSNVVNPEDVKQAEKEAKASQQDQAISHNKLYDKQAKLESLSRWPKQLEDSVKNGKYALEVVVYPKATKENTLPDKDEDNRLVGKLTKSDETSFEVKPRKGSKNEVFFLLEDETKITESGKTITVRDLSDKKDRYVVVTYYQGKFFGEKFSRNEVDLYKKHHAEQFDAVFQELGAVNVLKETVVQFRYSGGGGGAYGSGFKGQPPLKGVGIKGKGGDPKERDDPGEDDETDAEHLAGEVWIYEPAKKNKPPADNRFFAYVPKWKFDNAAKPEDIAEEIWIAQENLWVQRELYKRIKQANDSVAAFKPLDPNNKDLGKTKPVKFKNYYWEIELQLVNNNSVQVKLKNLRPYQQEVGNLHFLLKLASGAKPVVFPPEGKPFESAPVRPAGSKEGDTFSTKEPILVEGTRVDGIFEVAQVLTWETAAVKRIDLIVIGASKEETALGHRQAGKALVPYKKKPKDEKQEVDPKDLKDPKKGFGVPGPGGPGPGPGRDMAGSQSTTTHGLVRERYLEVTPQSRKLPVCLVLIVDPDHMSHVEAAFLDSPLRFLVTQVMWQRFQGSLRPPEKPGEGKDGKDTPAGPGITPPETATSSADEMENLELAIYGVITIYERPNRPQSQVQSDSK
jgi:hypothetical protein